MVNHIYNSTIVTNLNNSESDDESNCSQCSNSFIGKKVNYTKQKMNGLNKRTGILSPIITPILVLLSIPFILSGVVIVLALATIIAIPIIAGTIISCVLTLAFSPFIILYRLIRMCV
jgi:hypothetical protein